MIGDYSIKNKNSAIFFYSIPLLTPSPERYPSRSHAIQLLLCLSNVLHDVIDEYLSLSWTLNHPHHVAIIIGGEPQEHPDVSELTQVYEEPTDHTPGHQDGQHSHDRQLRPCDFVHRDA